MDEIIDIYELSPMQQGMLFHTLYAPNSGVYFEQLICTLDGDLQVLAFQQAWEQVVTRHPVFRTSFHWDELDKPLQVVHGKVDVPWEQQNWLFMTSDEQQKRLEAFLESDRQLGFDLKQAPLMRFTLIQVAATTWQFVWSNHHLLLDGWCLSIIFKEVFAFYEAFSQGKDIYLNITSRPYRDYIVWLQQQNLRQAETFWQQSLRGFSVPTALFGSKSSNGISSQEEKCDRQHLWVSETLSNALQTFTRQHHLTIGTLIQGVWALLLSYYSGESNVVFGVTVSGRPATLPGVESMVGLFINTLPARVQVANDISLLSWLQQLQTQHIEREQYAYTSLIDIQGWSDVPRGMTLFESIVVVENYPLKVALQEGFGGLSIQNVRGVERTNYPLALEAIPGQKLFLGIEYDSDRFDAATISRILGHFQTLLENIVNYPQQKISELSLLTTAERHQLLVEWNQTEAKYPQDKCIHELFAERVRQTPDAVAVVFQEQQLTYEELNARANQLAHHLQTQGVEPEVLVGICVERSLEMVVGLLAILKAGGAYVPLDPAYPPERLAYILNDSQVSVLVTTENLLARLPKIQGSVVCLDRDSNSIVTQSQQTIISGVNSENLAYLIYTSGSTGKPKGVAIAHRNLVNAYFAWEDAYQLQTSCNNHLQMASFSFDVFSGDLVRALCSGGKLVLCPREWLLEPEKLYELMQKEKIDCAEFVPAVFRNLIEYLKITEQKITFLRLLILGSDTWYMEEYQLFKQFCGTEIRLINSYGVSEATIDSSYFESTKVNLFATRAVPIGRPFANTKIYILDRYLQPVPIGVPGELYIGGAGLSRGYFNLPELTEQKFIPNPFSKDPKARLYKTGDFACYLPDGNIEFLGRLDNQVKIRGFRIELEEIEAVLNQHPEIFQALVVDQPEQSGNKQLVAYIVANQELVPNPRELRSFLKDKLPDHMIPSVFVALEVLPLTPNGKVDRHALPMPDMSVRTLDIEFVPPRNSIEENMANLWRNVLGVEQIGVEDNFFELGGHSLLATQLVSRFRQTFSVELTLRDLFEYPTIAELAELLVTKQLEQAEIDLLEQILNEVDELSDVEVNQQLYAESH
ncbi:amino acid adenylation domain-containing protein [Nostoc paludosum FACHB-159]|uniref:Amino acid adenylation domain-containing protein n=1 Tax=Nostoc paludosum FACHB-159 TaxID=2692908 RepID=A0ABR8KKA2_9NOSO|nr:amino acid adenylation domain-containing protein [Nostoc sp. FACHB-857]MBD2739134.1 amino acid adenylation domain-containing protein [Nostoc paludosum FACHB-159]